MHDFHIQQCKESYILIFTEILIFGVSVSELFKPVFILTSQNYSKIFPFITNVFCEKEFPMFVMSLILMYVFTSCMFSYLGVQKTIVYLVSIGYSSNTIVFFILKILGFKSLTVNGALSMIVGASFALLYLNRKHNLNLIFTSFEVQSNIIFIAVGAWVILCIRKDCGTMLTGVLAYGLSYLEINYFHYILDLEIEDNYLEQLIRPESRRNLDNDETKQSSILDALGLNQNQNLSEAEQNRRIRALRAIEERLDSI